MPFHTFSLASAVLGTVAAPITAFPGRPASAVSSPREHLVRGLQRVAQQRPGRVPALLASGLAPEAAAFVQKMRVTLMLVSLAMLLVVMLASPITCRPGLPNGHLTAHGFGKRSRWGHLFSARNVPLGMDRSRRVAVDLEQPLYTAYGLALSDPDSDADSY
ncbi:hypothetical protein FJT64_005644 [Amphibalanus amphitrite]|uniref:Uncharacterized protein n=1 Tax=Amphibalanus amphitrite TaxID=1232801 RepID=A0A6A4VRP6_AMPAM|nr:hypothetical protein FJT64_005644 [Amphibalanus amphitrite]